MKCCSFCAGPGGTALAQNVRVHVPRGHCGFGPARHPDAYNDAGQSLCRRLICPQGCDWEIVFHGHDHGDDQVFRLDFRSNSQTSFDCDCDCDCGFGYGLLHGAGEDSHCRYCRSAAKAPTKTPS